MARISKAEERRRNDDALAKITHSEYIEMAEAMYDWRDRNLPGNTSNYDLVVGILNDEDSGLDPSWFTNERMSEAINYYQENAELAKQTQKSINSEYKFELKFVEEQVDLAKADLKALREQDELNMASVERATTLVMKLLERQRELKQMIHRVERRVF